MAGLYSWQFVRAWILARARWSHRKLWPASGRAYGKLFPIGNPMIARWLLAICKLPAKHRLEGSFYDSRPFSNVLSYEIKWQREERFVDRYDTPRCFRSFEFCRRNNVWGRVMNILIIPKRWAYWIYEEKVVGFYWFRIEDLDSICSSAVFLELRMTIKVFDHLCKIMEK